MQRRKKTEVIHMISHTMKRYAHLKSIYPDRFADGQPDGLCMKKLPVGDPFPFGVLEEHEDWLWVREWNGSAAEERPVYLDRHLKKQIEGYFALMERRPDLFTPSDKVPICSDRHAMLRFIEETGRQVGLVFDKGKFYQVVADLIDGPHPFAYARVLYPDSKGNGTVIIPRLITNPDAPLFGILHIFRHSIRKMSGGEFPRGFQEPDITPEENALKELSEEFGITKDQLTGLRLLGHSRADTGLTSGQVQVYLADIAGVPCDAVTNHEGILRSEWLSESELEHRMAKGELIDGMSQTAFLLYKLSQTIQ